jgi:hypothetical protein
MNAAVSPGRMLGGVLEPLARAMTPASAREILALQADAGTQQRLEELGRRCDQGLLTPEERAEYQLYVEVGDVVALLRERARRFLEAHGPA